MMLERILDNYPDEDFLKADGFDDAVIGVEINTMVLIYSVHLCIEILKEEMNEMDAMEYFTYNVSGGYLGEKTPIWCWDM
jgi:hypothetical protein